MGRFLKGEHNFQLTEIYCCLFHATRLCITKSFCKVFDSFPFPHDFFFSNASSAFSLVQRGSIVSLNVLVHAENMTHTHTQLLLFTNFCFSCFDFQVSVEVQRLEQWPRVCKLLTGSLVLYC